MTPDEISSWIGRNLNESVIDKAHWRRSGHFGLEATLRERVEQGLMTNGEVGACAVIAAITTQARRMWIGKRRSEQLPRSIIV